MLRSPNTLPFFSEVDTKPAVEISTLIPGGAGGYPSGPVALNAIACPITTVCRVAGLGRTKLYELLAEGEITAVKVGRRTIVKLSSLQEFLARQPQFQSERERRKKEAPRGNSKKGDLS
mgnify:CR=1 FL=1